MKATSSIQGKTQEKFKFVAIENNPNIPPFKNLPGEEEEQLDSILKHIEKVCKELEEKEKDANWIISLCEYAIQEPDSHSVSNKLKKKFKEEMALLTAKYPQLTLIGNISTRKHFDKLTQEKLDKIKVYYQNDELFNQDSVKKSFFDALLTHEKTYLQQGGDVFRNTCYFFSGGECIQRYEKVLPYLEEFKNKMGIYQPGNKKGNSYLVNIKGLWIAVEVCREHFKGRIKQTKDSNHPPIDAHIVLSNTEYINLDHIVGQVLFQIDSIDKSFPIISEEKLSHSMEFYRSNLFGGDGVLQGPLPFTNMSDSLFLACYKGDIAKAIQLIRENNANQINEEMSLYGSTSLHQAIKTINNCELATALLNYRGQAEAINKFDQRNMAPLFYAIKNKNLEMIDLLIQYGADLNLQDPTGISALYLAVETGNIEVVRYLIEQGAIIDLPTNFMATPLYHAAQQGYVDIVEYLLLKGANINSVEQEGLSPLKIAIQNGHTDVTELLIKKGADLNIGWDDTTPLFLAVQNKLSVEVITLLIKNGIDVNQADSDGFKPLCMAIQNQDLTFIKTLIDFGAELDKEVAPGMLALHTAVENGYVAVVELLLDKGADINQVNSEGRAPMDLAEDNSEMINVLKKYSSVKI